ncbi:PD-(D/E)XK nuclease family protein [Candidatus Woesearchaeota archaeon]|nr:PD-(D/E)XK nuclease family protein [Candidatus Woesearchaeota archaeon]
MVVDILVEPARVQSPSSILTWKQCPRKYFYRYIARLPTGTSIHLIRGSIVHKVLEDIYDVDIANIPEESFPVTIKVILQEMFKKEWAAQDAKLKKLDLTEDQLNDYYAETKVMINNFFHYLMDKMRSMGDMPLKEAFLSIKPVREVELRSESHAVRGYADAIHKEGGKIVILDYKTSKRAELSPEYNLQLGIYGMIYEQLHTTPDEVGIFFLKHGVEKMVSVTPELIKNADMEVRFVHEQTKSKDIKDYQKRPGPLCKWRTGQCDFYDTCFSKGLMDYDEGLVRLGGKK